MGCPVHEDFDPLAPEFLADPYAVMATLPDDDQTIPFHPNISFRGPLELWVSSA